MLAEDLGEQSLQEGLGLWQVGVEAVGETLHLTQMPVLVMLQDELQERKKELLAMLWRSGPGAKASVEFTGDKSPIQG